MKLKIFCLAATSGLILAGCAVQPPGQPGQPAPGYDRSAPYGDGRVDDGRYGDGRYDQRRGDGRYNDGRYDDRYGDRNARPTGERYYDERARRYYYYDQRTGYTYWENGELRSR